MVALAYSACMLGQILGIVAVALSLSPIHSAMPRQTRYINSGIQNLGAYAQKQAHAVRTQTLQSRIEKLILSACQPLGGNEGGHANTSCPLHTLSPEPLEIGRKVC